MNLNLPEIVNITEDPEETFELLDLIGNPSFFFLILNFFQKGLDHMV